MAAKREAQNRDWKIFRLRRITAALSSIKEDTNQSEFQDHLRLAIVHVRRALDIIKRNDFK